MKSNLEMAIQRFKELRVYQIAFDASMAIFQHSSKWPREERYALIDQIRRSSRSVCANIAEAWSKRRYERHFISKLSDAEAESAETRVWLQYAFACEYLKLSDFESLDASYNRISGGLVKMMHSPEKWCGPSTLLREPLAVYILSKKRAQVDT